MHLFKTIIVAAVLASQLGASYRTENFVVTAPNASIAREVARTAEQYRRDIIEYWNADDHWSVPCVIVVLDPLDTGFSSTTVTLQDGTVILATIDLRGYDQKALTSILAHEICHAVLLYQHGTALPRWAEEGAAVMFERDRERRELRGRVEEIRKDYGEFTISELLSYDRSYPPEPLVFLFYWQAAEVTEWLIATHGRKKFLDLIGQWRRDSSDHAVNTVLGYDGMIGLERAFAQYRSQ